VVIAILGQNYFLVNFRNLGGKRKKRRVRKVNRDFFGGKNVSKSSHYEGKKTILKSPYIENTFQQVAISITRRRALWPGGPGRRGVGLFVSVCSLLHFSSLSLSLSLLSSRSFSYAWFCWLIVAYQFNFSGFVRFFLLLLLLYFVHFRHQAGLWGRACKW